MREAYSKRFLFIEGWGSIAVAAASVWAAQKYHFDLDHLLKDSRAGIYGSLTVLLGTLLGFVITGVSVILAFTEISKLAPLKKSEYYRDLFRIYTDTARWLAVGSAVSFLGLIFDKDASPQPIVTYSVFALLLLCVVRLYRCIWVIEALAKIVSTRPPQTRTTTSTP